MKSPIKSSKEARRAAFIPVIRELVRAYQAFEAYDAAHLRQLGLTSCQADVLFTLGNTSGMTFSEIGERTLITKGTLTGVIDRLEAKGIVRRQASATDRRSTLAVLTAKGEALFEDVYPRHIAHLQERFSGLERPELDETQRVLARLRALF